MGLNEIAERVVECYPDCCMAHNHVVKIGCREDWYEEYLINELMDFFSYEIVNICGCGNPESTHEIIRRLLNIRLENQEGSLKYEDMKQRYKEDLHLDISDDTHYGVLQFLLYMLDSCGIVELNGFIWGSLIIIAMAINGHKMVK